MTTDPGDYDLRELRRIADPNGELPIEAGAETGLPTEPVQEPDEEMRRFEQRDELVRLQSQVATTGQLPEKPYLTSLPKTYGSEVVVFEWLDFLINRAGFENTGNALAYYVDVGWINEEVRQSLRAYMRGFSEVERFEQDDDPLELESEDHSLSLVYIARLASMS